MEIDIFGNPIVFGKIYLEKEVNYKVIEFKVVQLLKSINRKNNPCYVKIDIARYDPFSDEDKISLYSDNKEKTHVQHKYFYIPIVDPLKSDLIKLTNYEDGYFSESAQE